MTIESEIIYCIKNKTHLHTHYHILSIFKLYLYRRLQNIYFRDCDPPFSPILPFALLNKPSDQMFRSPSSLERMPLKNASSSRSSEVLPYLLAKNAKIPTQAKIMPKSNKIVKKRFRRRRFCPLRPSNKFKKHN